MTTHAYIQNETSEFAQLCVRCGEAAPHISHCQTSVIYSTPQTIVLRKNNGKVIYIASSDEAAIDAGHELNQRGKGKAARVARLVAAGAPIPYEMQGNVLDGSEHCKAEWVKRSESMSALRVWLLARLSLTEEAVHSTPGHSGQFDPAISTLSR